MQGEFKQCPNGHYYQGTSCPYCKTGAQSGNATSLKTEAFINEDYEETDLQDTYNANYSSTGTKTSFINENKTSVNTNKTNEGCYIGSRTVFGDEEYDFSAKKETTDKKKEPRFSRKLVGWLVTYSFDELGVDFKLYEGRNVIGRDMDCNITINDGHISSKHAVLLFRANKYSLTDTQSSHGTFVNEEDIELEPRYLKDGDIIRMGNTIFKFRTSL